MNRIINLGILILLFSCSIEQTKEFETSKTKSKIFVEEYMNSNKVPGMQIAISFKGNLVFSKGFGYSNIELDIPVNTKSKFKIASVSKPIAAVLTARLFQNSVVDIDKPVNETLLQFSNKEDFTLRQLYCHAAGIRHYEAKDTATAKFHNNIQNGLNIIKNDTLLYKPGLKYSYSSYGYNVAGAYIERITNQQFVDLLRDSLFIPLNMNNSTIDDPYRIISNRVSGYELNEKGEIVNARFFDNRYKIPAGGILTTAEDLTIIGNELLYGNYLNERSKELLFTPFQYDGEDFSDTGFGWVVTKDNSGNRVFGHLGGITGGCSIILIYPDLELIIAWLGNRDTDWSPEPAFRVADYFIENIKKEYPLK